MPREPALEPRDAERAGGLDDHAAVLEDVFDRRADLVGAHEDHFVDHLAREPERLVADSAHGDTVRERPHVVERERRSALQRLVHARGLERLDADHLHARIALLEVRADAADQAAAADRHEYRVRHTGPLLLELHRDRALPRDHVRIVERVHERAAAACREVECEAVRVVVGDALEQHFAAERRDGLHLDRRRRGAA